MSVVIDKSGGVEIDTLRLSSQCLINVAAIENDTLTTGKVKQKKFPGKQDNSHLFLWRT
jgi:hypothetical protein